MRRPPWWRTAAYLFLVTTVAFSLWLMVHYYQADQARTCINSWESREQIRDMSEKVYRTNAETLIGLSARANPDRIAGYRAQVDRDVRAIRATLPNPTCDLQAAKRRLR